MTQQSKSKFNLNFSLILVFALLGMFLFTACSKDDVQDPDSMEIDEMGNSESDSLDEGISQYPSSIDDYVSSNYPNLHIVEVEQETEDGVTFYEVELNDHRELLFDEMGNFVSQSGGEVMLSELPMFIISYVEQNYPNANITEAEEEFNGNYEVELDNGLELYFDSAGNILYIENEEEYEEHEDESEMDISISTLPLAITNYITQNYPNAEIVQADILMNGDYKVRISSEGDIELFFDEQGSFLREETEFRLVVSSVSLPDTVNIGESVSINAFLVNNNVQEFQGKVKLPYGVELNLPTDLNSTVEDGSTPPNTFTIAPKDSIPVNISISIDAAKFIPQTNNIVILWPEVTNELVANPYVLGGGHGYVQTFVN